jgi:glycosyltransferase involved in cell wall biosynthesis
MKSILHICPGYLQTSLYHNLFFELENIEQKNIVYVTSLSAIRIVPYEINYLNRSFSIFDRFFYYRKQNIIFNDICKKEYLKEIKLLHAHTLFSAGYAAYRISKEKNLKYIVAIRNTDVNVFFKKMLHLRSLGVMVMCNAEKIIFLSEAYKKAVLDKFVPESKRNLIEEKSIIIPNGIDNYFLENKYYRKKENKNNIINILFIGDIVMNKNIVTTIKACNYLRKEGYNIIYNIVGEIKNCFIEWQINKSFFVSYHQKCNKEQILNYMRESDIFVMPSITETFGLVYPEAMSQGMPIIYSKGQGFDGYFGDGDVGFSVKCMDYKTIAKKIIEIYTNYNSISERCTNYVDKFDWKKISLEYKRIYDSLYGIK